MRCVNNFQNLFFIKYQLRPSIIHHRIDCLLEKQPMKDSFLIKLLHSSVFSCQNNLKTHFYWFIAFNATLLLFPLRTGHYLKWSGPCKYFSFTEFYVSRWVLSFCTMSSLFNTTRWWLPAPPVTLAMCEIILREPFFLPASISLMPLCLFKASVHMPFHLCMLMSKWESEKRLLDIQNISLFASFNETQVENKKKKLRKKLKCLVLLTKW